MKGLKSIAIALCAALVVSCGMSNTGKGALIGAGGGAGLGAIIGATLPVTRLSVLSSVVL